MQVYTAMDAGQPVELSSSRAGCVRFTVLAPDKNEVSETKGVKSSSAAPNLGRQYEPEDSRARVTILSRCEEMRGAIKMVTGLHLKPRAA